MSRIDDFWGAVKKKMSAAFTPGAGCVKMELAAVPGGLGYGADRKVNESDPERGTTYAKRST